MPKRLKNKKSVKGTMRGKGSLRLEFPEGIEVHQGEELNVRFGLVRRDGKLVGAGGIVMKKPAPPEISDEAKK